MNQMHQKVGGRRRGEDAFRLIDRKESEFPGPGPSPGGSASRKVALCVFALAPGAAPVVLSVPAARPHQGTLLP